MPNKASYLNYLRKLDKIVIPREFTYWVQGELDELTKQKLQCMRYTIGIKHICNKIITRISW